MRTIANPFYAGRIKRVATPQEAHHRPVTGESSHLRDRLDASLAHLTNDGDEPPPTPRFALGEVVYSGNAALRLRTEEVLTALRRHANGDWGDLLPEDAIANELAMKYAGRLFSAYGFGCDRFWVITDFELSLTEVLLPDD
jgi:hypothetical protein